MSTKETINSVSEGISELQSFYNPKLYTSYVLLLYIIFKGKKCLNLQFCGSCLNYFLITFQNMKWKCKSCG